MVSDGALATKDRLELAQAKLPHRVVPQSGLPVRLQVKRRPNTTTAKVMELLREVFGQEVELLPKERRRDTVYLECNGRVCHRMLRHYGGENYVHGHAGDERQRRNRQRRRREKAALYQAQYKLVDEFDILPIREDKKTIVWDLC
ncbi:MAG TPA: hypothetical protein VD907_00430 [Verrucomicrobiae bacterium]|nr:hypothetical protein [Verrucomicrobiae bacterium]